MKDEFLIKDYRTPKGEKEYLYLIIYDVIDNKRRTRLFKFLNSYGSSVQKSCFEAYLTQRQYRNVEKRMISLIDSQEDNIRVYQLNGLNKVYNYGIENKNAYIDLLIL
ncbi:MAG: CRISPR-associated endonuclease Cas2 [Peptoniphilaceae bacterium]